MLPIRITQNPQNTKACSRPITGLRNRQFQDFVQIGDRELHTPRDQRAADVYEDVALRARMGVYQSTVRHHVEESPRGATNPEHRRAFIGLPHFDSNPPDRLAVASPGRRRIASHGGLNRRDPDLEAPILGRQDK